MLDKSEMIFGVRAVIEAIQAGKEIDKILVKKDIQSDLSKELFAALKGLMIPVQRVPVERINRITRKNHCFHFFCDLSENGRSCSFLVRTREESVFCYAGRSDRCT